MNVETGKELNIIEENTKRDMSRLEGTLASVDEKVEVVTAA